MGKKALYTNRLIKEKSPYLLQHAHNPVDWYPWSDEAFKAAETQEKPIFLSIGYSSCHWCHVMEKESFENPEVAQMMNDTFINIKVDREELPSVDSLYMEFAQSLLAGASGWPLNVILTPQRHPFFAVTYVPPHTNRDMIGLDELILCIHHAWNDVEERERLQMQSLQITELFANNIHISGEEILEKEDFMEAVEYMFKMSDTVYGGLKGSPKFPMGYFTSFLLNYTMTAKDSRGLFIAERTLEMMHRGGIYDHLGGGFARYSVDEKWFLPHFEKMLYDNAFLAKSYFEVGLALNKEHYRDISDDILTYLERDMRHSQGGYYSAEDADSEGHEGIFYTWSYQEIQNLLKEHVALFCQYFGVLPEGNFEGRNILHLNVSLDELATANEMTAAEASKILQEQCQLLFEVRQQRPKPHKDEKIIVSWNGLMIDTLATVADPRDSFGYLQHAEQAAEFLQANCLEEGRLKRRWIDGEASFNAGLDDYAFLIKGLISLFEATGKVHWLRWALELNEAATRLFKSSEGAYFQTSEEDDTLILRKTYFSDGAEASGNSVQCENLLRLYALTWNERYLESAKDILKAAEMLMARHPAGFVYQLMNLNRYYDLQRPTIVIALNSQREHEDALKQIFYSHFIPHKTVIWKACDDNELAYLLPNVALQTPIADKTTLYICHQGRCDKPLTDFAQMEKAILE